MPTATECNDIATNMEELRQEFRNHIKHFSVHEKEEIDRHNTYVDKQEQNITAIHGLTEALDKQIQSTQALVDVITTGRTLGRFGKWLGSVAILGWIIKWAADHL